MKARFDIANAVMSVALPAIIFLAFYNPAILDPHNVGWLLRGTDNGENALGLHAWQNDAARGLSLRTHLLNFPDGVALLFTDSNPLLAVVTLPLAWALGNNVQFIGLWVLVCLVLHALLARRLLAPHAQSKPTLWIGVALMMLLPTLYARHLHVNLQAHWLILWALWIFVDDKRSRDMRWWTANLVVAALVHNYLLFIVGAVWGSAVLRNVVTGGDARHRLVALGKGVATLAIVAVVISRLGIHRDFVPTNTYGVFAMPLDALWRPSNPSYSMLIPWSELRLRSAFEGFQYLGVGLLILVAAVPFIIARARRNAPDGSLNRRLIWLLPACVLLTMLAISHQVALGGAVVAQLPLGPAATAFLDPLRASGRLFWLVSYVMAFVAITSAYRLSRERATQLLGVALTVQLLDLSGVMIAMQRTTREAAAPDPWKRTADPRWPTIIASARDVTFAPADPFRALDLFQEVAWRAVSAGKPVRMVYAARNSRATDARLARENADFDAGRLDQQRLYVVFPGTPIPPGARSRLVVLDGVRLLVPVRASARSVPS